VVVRDACKKRESPLDVAQLVSVQRIDTFTGGWRDYEAVGNPAGFYKDPFGMVRLSGSIFGGAPGSHAFTLPTGFRGGAAFFASSSSDAAVSSSFCTITIYPTGDVVVGTNCNNAQVGLDGITFLATG
jgi:hypothetical protein